MKLKAREIERFLEDPGNAVAALIFGPDSGLVSERAKRLAGTIVEDTSDPFRVCTLTEADVKSDPARLFDEAAAISMAGGRRMIGLRINGDSVGKSLDSYLAAIGAGELQTDTFLIIEAGDLAARSSVRKLFEAAKNAGAIPCYQDDAATVSNLVERRLADVGWRVPPDTMDFLVNHLGSDRQITLQELEKLALYLGPGDGRSDVPLDDAQQAVGDASALTVDGLIDAVGSGNLNRVDTEMTKCYNAGQTPVGLLRAAINHFMKLARVSALSENGEAVDRAIGKLRPPLHFKRRRNFEQQIRIWRSPLIGQALDLLLASEARCKSSGYPAELICSDTFMKLASKARSLTTRR